MSLIEVLDSFLGASLGTHHLADRHLSAGLREEPLVRRDGIVHDYSWHFVFGLKNNSDKPEEVTVSINCQGPEGLPYKAHILGQHEILHDFYPLNDVRALTDTFKKYFISLVLKPGETRYLSNTYFRSLNLVTSLFKGLSQASPAVKTIVYGKSVEGRDLAAYVYGDPESGSDARPTIVVTSGFHPMEADTFATEAIMEYLDGPDGVALLNHFDFVIIPLVNPDGFHHGYNGCNAKGINLYWDFREKDKVRAPESYYLWDYLCRVRPSVYIDFHSYTFQLHRKSDGPYLKPLYFYRGKEIQNLVRAVNHELKALHQGRYSGGDLTCTPSSLPYKLTKKFNTITYAKYHLHIGAGKEGFKNKAVTIVKTIARQMQAHQIFDEKRILAAPYGTAKGRLKDFLKRNLRMIWTFHIKIALIRFLAKTRLRNAKT